MTEKEILKYLLRINFTGNPGVELKTLAYLQKLHLLNIPFENLDIHAGKPIKLSIGNFYEKIVIHKRGGFCYELNGLFFELLSDLGFNAYLVSARVFETQDTFGDEFDHLAIIVVIDGINWLADVGFGEFAFAPLKISIGEEQKDERGVFRINNFDNNYLVVQKKSSEGWKNEYLFSMKPRVLDDFTDKCEYHQISVESHFTRKKLCSIPFKNGRITLTDKILKISNDSSTEETEVKDEAHFNKLLKKYFNIEM
jgi:N-hydroxyarylamine O-acetyltransferase